MEFLPKLPIAVATCALVLSGCGDGGSLRGILMDIPENDGIEVDRRASQVKTDGWVQYVDEYGFDDRACVRANLAEPVLSIQECQDRARAKGHIFYQFFETKARKKCATSRYCVDSVRSVKNPGWTTYRQQVIWPQSDQGKCERKLSHGWLQATSQEECQKAVVALGGYSYLFHVQSLKCGVCAEESTIQKMSDPFWRVFRQGEDSSSGVTCGQFLQNNFGNTCNHNDFFQPDSGLANAIVPQTTINALDWQYCCKPKHDNPTCENLLGSKQCSDVNNDDKELHLVNSAKFSVRVPGEKLMSYPHVVNHCCDNANPSDPYEWVCDSGAGRQRGAAINNDENNRKDSLEDCKNQCSEANCGLLEYNRESKRCLLFSGWNVAFDICYGNPDRNTWYNPKTAWVGVGGDFHQFEKALFP